MRSQMLLPFLLGAAAASPATGLTERQAPRSINIDVYLPKITFLGLGSPSVLQWILLSNGYSGINGNYFSACGGSLSQIFSQSATPLNTFAGQYLPPVTQQQSNSNTKYNYSANALIAGVGSQGGFSAAASSGAWGEGAAGGIAVSNFQPDFSGPSAEAYAYAHASYSIPADTYANVDRPQKDNNYLANVTVALPTQYLSRLYHAGVNETFDLGACAAQSSGASAYAGYNTTTTIAVNGSSYGTPMVISRASTTCSAGAYDPKNPDSVGVGIGKRDAASGFPLSNPSQQKEPAYALSSTLAAPKQKGGVQAFVNCKGFTQTGLQFTKYRLQIQGTFSLTTGFVGNIIGTSQSTSTASCS